MAAKKNKGLDREIEMEVTVRPARVARAADYAFSKSLSLLAVQVPGRGTFVIATINGVAKQVQGFPAERSCEEAVQDCVRDTLVRALHSTQLGQIIAKGLKER